MRRKPHTLIDYPALEVLWWLHREWKWRRGELLGGMRRVYLLWFEIRFFNRECRERYQRELARKVYRAL
jgi:hypothetical protein